MTEYIKEFKYSIPPNLCDDIIELYEKADKKYPGVTYNGHDKNVKNTMDLMMPKDDNVWSKIETFLYKELSKKLILYFDILGKTIQIKNYKYFKNQDLFSRCFLLQKYQKNVGKYIYHDDFLQNENSSRVITFLWYLNDVDTGGFTEFWNSYKIKPERGKLLLFPSTWSYPHSGLIPTSHDKYIITGWVEIKKLN